MTAPGRGFSFYLSPPPSNCDPSERASVSSFGKRAGGPNTKVREREGGALGRREVAKGGRKVGGKGGGGGGEILCDFIGTVFKRGGFHVGAPGHLQARGSHEKEGEGRGQRFLDIITSPTSPQSQPPTFSPRGSLTSPLSTSPASLLTPSSPSALIIPSASSQNLLTLPSPLSLALPAGSEP